MNKKKHLLLHKIVVKVIGSGRRSAISIPIFSVLLSLIAAGIILAILKINPFSAYYAILQGSGVAPKSAYAAHASMLSVFSGFVNAWTPMLFAALAVAVAMMTGLFNIGVSGQMLFSGFIATILVGYMEMNSVIAKILVLLIGIVCGALIGSLIGFLKYKFNINEVVSSIMLNYIVSYIISFFINTRFVDPVTRQSKNVKKCARLTLSGVMIGDIKYDIPLGIVLAIAAAVLIYFLMNRTVAGFEMKAVGKSRTAALYAGVNVGKNVVISMMLSGALAGLAGVTYYLGYFTSIQPKVLPSMGFDSIAVTLLGNNNPIAIIFSSFVLTVFSKGSTYMSSVTGADAELASLITGFILLFSACNAFIAYKVKKSRDILEEAAREEEKEG